MAKHAPDRGTGRGVQGQRSNVHGQSQNKTGGRGNSEPCKDGSRLYQQAGSFSHHVALHSHQQQPQGHIGRILFGRSPQVQAQAGALVGQQAGPGVQQQQCGAARVDVQGRRDCLASPGRQACPLAGCSEQQDAAACLQRLAVRTCSPCLQCFARLSAPMIT